MVIPGVSGSMVLMLMGFYHPILNAIKDFFTALAAFDMEGILAGCGILVPFGIGMVAGILSISSSYTSAKSPYSFMSLTTVYPCSLPQP